MILTITDEGDPTVGMFPQSWNIECPIEETADGVDLIWFREKIINL